MDRLTQLNSQLTSGVNWAESARATLSKADGSAQQADGGEGSFSPMEGVEEGSRQLQGQDAEEGTEGWGGDGDGVSRGMSESAGPSAVGSPGGSPEPEVSPTVAAAAALAAALTAANGDGGGGGEQRQAVALPAFPELPAIPKPRRRGRQSKAKKSEVRCGAVPPHFGCALLCCALLRAILRYDHCCQPLYAVHTLLMASHALPRVHACRGPGGAAACLS
jgi:hypothetical protein